MTLEDFQAEFEAARKFVRLHGWVVQSEEKLDPLRQGLSAEADAEALLSAVLESFPASTTQEKLFALCLLRDSRLSADHLAGLLFEHLQGELTSTDGQFFLRQFFRHGPPVPLEVSRQITDRVYLTYQRAILQAMKIEQFESSYDAPQIVLFLTHLLCRIELNEQNRAILYLLLSRIDAPLPESLNLAVSRAMNGLQEIIRDVELRQDKVLSEEHPAAPAASAQDPWAPRLQTARRPSEASAVPAAASPPKQLFELTRSGPVSPADGRAQPVVVTVTNTPKTEQFPVWDELSPVPKDSRPSQTTPSPGISPPQKPLLAAKSLVEDPRAESEGTKRSSTWERSAADSETRQSWEAQERLTGEPTAPPSQGEGGKSFVIRFNQEKSELSSLLKLLASGPAVQEPEPAHDKKLFFARRLWKRRWWMAVLVAILAAALLMAGLLHPAPVPSKGVQTVLEPPLPVSEVRPSQDLDIRIRPEGKFWYPRSGESLWKLYTRLRSESGAVEAWTDFQKKILSLNPSVAEADLIFPANPLKFAP